MKKAARPPLFARIALTYSADFSSSGSAAVSQLIGMASAGQTATRQGAPATLARPPVRGAGLRVRRGHVVVSSSQSIRYWMSAVTIAAGA